MADFIVAVGLVLVIEGALYALFPFAMQKMMRQAIEFPAGSLRVAGFVAVVLGFLVVWLMRA